MDVTADAARSRLGAFASLAVDWQGNAEYVDRVVDAAEMPAPGQDALDALFEIFRQLQETEASLDGVFALIVEKAAGLLKTDMAWSTLVDHPHDSQRIRASWGARSPGFADVEMKLGTGIGGQALLRQRTLVVTDYESHAHQTPPHVREAILDEGLVSLICAPMIVRGVSVGLLYVGNRTRTAFGVEQCSIVSMLAAQASLAIWNGRLHRELERRHETLERSLEIHRELTSAALRGAGVEGISDRLGRLLGREVVVDACGDGHEPARRGGDGETEVAIRAGARRLGTVRAGGGPLTELEQRALQHGAAALALELLKERGARSVERRLQSELLDDLVQPESEASEGVALRASRLGISLTGLRAILVLAPCEPALDGSLLFERTQAALAELADSELGASLACQRGGQVIVALPLAPEQPAAAPARVVQDSLARDGIDATIGVSRPGSNFSASYREALACAELGLQARSRAPIVDAAALGSLRFLLDAPDLGLAEEMVRERLGPVAASQRLGTAPLLETLSAYLDAGGHHPTTAAACSIHRSSLKYRLGRIQELLGQPLADPDVRFELGLAFRVLDLLEGLGFDPLGRSQRAAD